MVGDLGEFAAPAVRREHADDYPFWQRPIDEAQSLFAEAELLERNLIQIQQSAVAQFRAGRRDG